ncbi:mitochondrial thiamine pyrophosphate carrier-like isoform X4 [Zootermopsis nevadensis]|uniref:mitochondrial thiamine pyrophosphate carrier-like isoform X4 n=1 Tax=Zootermopsis nevadensis TaxID=136037 RepID=UPI000B8EA709|nr:mitochondrial thiamine pyrophosphate carrier-like isoform X4 [Zootermopsis nevadensis]
MMLIGIGWYIMVGFDPEAKKKLSTVEHGTAGGISSALTRFLCQPLDVIKIRFQFVSFEFLTQQTWYLIPRFREDVYRPVVHFVCGGIAGSLATVFSFPSDVVRTRLIAQGEPKVCKNVLQVCTMIYTKEGPRAFFKGLSPTLIQIAPHTGVQFACYNIFTTIWKNIGKLIVEDLVLVF